MPERIPEEAIEAANRAASPTMGYRASARRAVIAAAPAIRAPLEALIDRAFDAISTGDIAEAHRLLSEARADQPAFDEKP